MKKDDKYSFRINKEVKDKFKAYCKVMGISPSDVLCDIMVQFNRDAEQIIRMKDIDELQLMLEGKYTQGKKELDALKAERR